MSEQVHCNRTNAEIGDDEWQIIEGRMKNPKFSSMCFLQEDEDVRNIIRKDAEYLESVGITCEQIADRLQSIVDQYNRIVHVKHTERYEEMNKFTYRCKVEDYTVYEVGYMGAQQCPFQNKELDGKYHGYKYGSSDIFIFKNESIIENGEDMYLDSYKPETLTKCDLWFNTLLIHMIRAHGFFEGPNQNHRLDPQKVIEVLNIEPNIDYKMPKVIDYLWSMSSSSSNYDNNYKQRIELNSVHKQELDANTTVYLMSKALYDLVQCYNVENNPDFKMDSLCQRYDEYVAARVKFQKKYEMTNDIKTTLQEIMVQEEKIMHVVNGNLDLSIGDLVDDVKLVAFGKFPYIGKGKYNYLGADLELWAEQSTFNLYKYEHVVIE